MENEAEIRVIAHDGYRANERPMAVVLAGERLPVVTIEDAWRAAGVDPRSDVQHGYVVRCLGGARFRLVFTEGRGWSGERLPGPRLVNEK